VKKQADLKVTILQNGNIIYEWWCSVCKTYHYEPYCSLASIDNNDSDFIYGLS